MPARILTFIAPDFMQVCAGAVVEVDIDEGGKMWINIDGMCRLRVRDAADIVVNDRRRLVKKPPAQSVKRIGGRRGGNVSREI